jgi:hypothetical protein
MTQPRKKEICRYLVILKIARFVLLKLNILYLLVLNIEATTIITNRTLAKTTSYISFKYMK